jgi:hypothetical protein
LDCEGGYRDVAMLEECDSAVQTICKLCSWNQELSALVKGQGKLTAGAVKSTAGAVKSTAGAVKSTAGNRIKRKTDGPGGRCHNKVKKSTPPKK